MHICLQVLLSSRAMSERGWTRSLTSLSFSPLYSQDLNLTEVKEAIIKEIMEYHEPKKPLHLDDKFNLRPVRVDSQQSKKDSNIILFIHNRICKTRRGIKEIASTIRMNAKYYQHSDPAKNKGWTGKRQVSCQVVFQNLRNWNESNPALFFVKCNTSCV